jgi:hypothetical protein
VGVRIRGRIRVRVRVTVRFLDRGNIDSSDSAVGVRVWVRISARIRVKVRVGVLYRGNIDGDNSLILILILILTLMLTPILNRFDVSGYPTIKFFPAGSGDSENYEQNREVEDMVTFINEKAGKG